MPHDEPRRRCAERQQRARRRVGLVQDHDVDPLAPQLPGQPRAQRDRQRAGQRADAHHVHAGPPLADGPPALVGHDGPHVPAGGRALAQRAQHRLHAPAHWRVELADVQHPHRRLLATCAYSSCTRATCSRTSKRSTTRRRPSPAQLRMRSGSRHRALDRRGQPGDVTAGDAQGREPAGADDLVGAAAPRPHDRPLARHCLGDDPPERFRLDGGVDDHVQRPQDLRHVVALPREGHRAVQGQRVAEVPQMTLEVAMPARGVELSRPRRRSAGPAGARPAPPPLAGKPPAPSSAPARRPSRPRASPAASRTPLVDRPADRRR